MDENPYKAPEAEAEGSPVNRFSWRRVVLELIAIPVAIAVGVLWFLLVLIAAWWILPRLFAWWFGSGGQLSG